jgi:hypothetical protein
MRISAKCTELILSKVRSSHRVKVIDSLKNLTTMQRAQKQNTKFLKK